MMPPETTGIDSDILVVVAQNNAIKAGQCILRQHSEGEVASHQVRGDGVVTRSTVADGKTWLDFTSHSDLLETNDAALILTDTDKEDAGGAIFVDR
jgi:hypothetical protein